MEDDDANESCILLADEEEPEMNTSATGTQQPILVVPDEEVPRRITMITTCLDTRQDLADTGATISATGIRSILHRFQVHSDYEIKGYDGQVTKAAGQGFARIFNPKTRQPC